MLVMQLMPFVTEAVMRLHGMKTRKFQLSSDDSQMDKGSPQRLPLSIWLRNCARRLCFKSAQVG